MNGGPLRLDGPRLRASQYRQRSCLGLAEGASVVSNRRAGIAAPAVPDASQAIADADQALRLCEQLPRISERCGAQVL